MIVKNKDGFHYIGKKLNDSWWDFVFAHVILQNASVPALIAKEVIIIFLNIEGSGFKGFMFLIDNEGVNNGITLLMNI